MSDRTTPPLAGSTTPIYRRRFGDVEVTVISDGYLDASTELFAIDQAEADRLVQAAFRPPAPALQLNVNAYVLNTGRKLVMFDAGAVKGFSPTLSKLPERLREAGFAPEQFDAVALTHLHPDHIGALVDETGAARFANAEILFSANERKFWWDDGVMAQAPEMMQGFIKAARATLAPYDKAIRTFERDGEILPGVDAVALHGHTPGHTGYRVGSGADGLLIWGDIVHAPVLQFPRPETTVAFDADPAQAKATRRAIFERAAADRLVVAGMHMEFPCFSHVVRDGAGYRAAPLRWRID